MTEIQNIRVTSLFIAGSQADPLNEAKTSVVTMIYTPETSQLSEPNIHRTPPTGYTLS